MPEPNRLKGEREGLPPIVAEGRVPNRGVAFQLLERRATTGRQPDNDFEFSNSVLHDAQRPAWHSAQAGRCSLLPWLDRRITHRVRPPGLAAAQIFFFERWYFAPDVIRSSRGSPPSAELAPMTARQAAASEAVDWSREMMNIRASEFVDCWCLIPGSGCR